MFDLPDSASVIFHRNWPDSTSAYVLTGCTKTIRRSTILGTFSKAVFLFLSTVCALSLSGRADHYPQSILQTGETGQAWSMDFSPNGSLFATANDHRVSLYEREHKWLIREFRGHTASVEAVAFAPTGKTVASGSSNGELATWDVDSGILLELRKANTSQIAGIKYSSGGKILTAGWDRTVRIWDDAKCQDSCVLAQTSESPESLAVSIDDKWIAVGDTANTVTVWQFDVSTLSAHLYHSLALPDKLPGGADFVRGLAFDKLGRLAAVNFGGALVLQDVASWTTVFQQHTGLRLDGVAVAPDGSRIYVAGVEGMYLGRILSFDAKNGSRIPLDELPAYWSPNVSNGNPYRSISVTHDGKWMLAGGTYFLQWNLSETTAPELFGETVRVAPGTIFSPNADSIIVPLAGVHFFSVLRGHFETLPPQPNLADLTITGGFGQTAMSADDRYIATPGLSRAFTRFLQENCSTAPPDQVARCTQEILQRKDLPAMTSLLLFRGSDLTFMTEFEMDQGPRPQFSQDGALLLWRTKEGLVTIDTACMCNRRRFSIPLPDEGFFDLAIDATATLVAMPKAGTNGVVIQLFSLETNSVVNTLQLDGSRSVRQLIFNSGKSDATRILAVGTTSGDLLLWHPKDKTAERIQGNSPVTSLAFNHDGNVLAIGREDGGLSVLSFKTKKVSEVRNAHASAVEGLRFGFGGRWISSLSQDAVQFWDSADLSNIGTLIFPSKDGTLSWLFVNPQGLFEGESRALGSMLWRFSPHLTDVTPVELFERDYFCQGLIKAVLLEGHVSGPSTCKTPALRSRNRNVPVLQIALDINDKSQTVKAERVTVNIHLRRAVVAGGQVEQMKDVRLFRNGLLAKHWHGVIPTSVQDLSADIPITAGINEFTAYAFNTDNVKSVDATDGVLGDQSLAKLGVTYILSVGVDTYFNGIPPLHYSGNDARAFAAAIASIQGGNPVRVAILADAEATRENILCGLKRLASGQNPQLCSPVQLNNLQPTRLEDSVYIFFSGHGAAEKSGFALFPQDAAYFRPTSQTRLRQLRNVVSESDLERELEPILAIKQVLVLDACSAGSLITAADSTSAPLNLNGFGQMAREKGLYILAAATARQSAIEGPARGLGSARSIMNYVLLEEGLVQGRAVTKPSDGTLLIEDWFNYAVGHVPSAADQQPVAFLPMRQENTRPGILGYFKKQ